MNTYNLLIQIKELLANQDVELEILELYHYDIKDCIGCDCCILNGKCVLPDDVSQIMDTLTRADGIILASPVYLQQVSGKMKIFFGRTCRWYHRPELVGKPVLSVATTKGSGLKATLSYMENVAAQWGAITAGAVGRTIFTLQKPVSKKELTRFIRLLNAPCSYSPTLNQLIGFEVQKSLAQYLNGLDTAYWESHGWMNKPYFFHCKVNPGKRVISGTVGQIMRKNMGKGPALDAVQQQEQQKSEARENI